MLSSAIMACEPNKSVSEKPINSAEIKNESIQSRYNYERDWESIKKAIIENNEKELANWISNEDLSASDVLLLFNLDKEALKALEKTSYKDLKTEELEGEVYLEFSFEQYGKDDEGTEYESAIFLYLKQGDPNLTVHNILAAG